MSCMYSLHVFSIFLLLFGWNKSDCFSRTADKQGHRWQLCCLCILNTLPSICPRKPENLQHQCLDEPLVTYNWRKTVTTIQGWQQTRCCCCCDQGQSNSLGHRNSFALSSPVSIVPHPQHLLESLHWFAEIAFLLPAFARNWRVIEPSVKWSKHSTYSPANLFFSATDVPITLCTKKQQ